MSIKKRIIFLAHSVWLALCVPALALAQDSSAGGTSGPGVNLNPLGSSSIFDLIDKILTAFTAIAGPIAVVFIAYAGFLYVTSQGDSGKLETAKKALLWTLVGLAIIFGARILSAAIQASITDVGGEL
ncbi:MAG: pilin [bacterium]|nr:pilin [bacterium]